MAFFIQDKSNLTVINDFIQLLSAKTSKYIIPVFFNSVHSFEAYDKPIHFDFIIIEMYPFLDNKLNIHKLIENHSTSYGTPIIMIQNKTVKIPDSMSLIPFAIANPPLDPQMLMNHAASVIYSHEKYKAHFVIKNKQTTFFIDYDNILYFETTGKKIKVVCCCETINFNASMCRYTEDLIANGFIQIHKSFFVNSKYIMKRHKDEITLTNNTTLHISRGYSPKVSALLNPLHT